jgi:hypothetical protein
MRMPCEMTLFQVGQIIVSMMILTKRKAPKARKP